MKSNFEQGVELENLVKALFEELGIKVTQGRGSRGKDLITDFCALECKKLNNSNTGIPIKEYLKLLSRVKMTPNQIPGFVRKTPDDKIFIGFELQDFIQHFLKPLIDNELI